MKPKRTFRSFIKNVKERKDRSVLYAKIVPLFYKERKRTQERYALLKRTDAQPWIEEVVTMKIYWKIMRRQCVWLLSYLYQPPGIR